MKYSIILLTLFSGLILSACDRPVVDNTADTVVVPVPTPVPGPAGEPGAAGPSGAEGATGAPGEPGNPSGDTVIVVPPPEVNMPADVVPPAETPPAEVVPPAN